MCAISALNLLYSIPERSPLVPSVVAHAFNSTQWQRQKDSTSGKLHLDSNAELSSFLQNSPGSFSAAAVTINCKSHGSVQEVTAMSERGAEDSLHQDSQERNSDKQARTPRCCKPMGPSGGGPFC